MAAGFIVTIAGVRTAMAAPSLHRSSDASWASGVLERAPGAEGLSVGADFVILDGAGQVVRGLNATGAGVWELCDGRRPLAEIASTIARRYAQPVPRVLADVIAFARTLEQKGLLRRRPGGQGQR